MCNNNTKTNGSITQNMLMTRTHKDHTSMDEGSKFFELCKLYISAFYAFLNSILVTARISSTIVLNLTYILVIYTGVNLLHTTTSLYMYGNIVNVNESPKLILLFKLHVDES